ncbi:MAG: DHHA1 domain-containing protein, partial [Actinomycetota bacterium]|nr:DHHA1 domain-containing protein [Actinomycetota bacterium]
AGDRSMELCGGTHVDRLGQIGPLEIVSEASIGSNLRRIEATTGTTTLMRLRHQNRVIAQAASLLRATPDELPAAIERKLADLHAAEDGLRSARQTALAGQAGSLAEAAIDGQVVARCDGLPSDQLRELAAQVRQRPGIRVVVLGGSPEGAKVALVALVAKGEVPTAPELIADAAKMVGGGGGGKQPEAAQAGGRDPARLDDALDAVRAKLGLPV